MLQFEAVSNEVACIKVLKNRQTVNYILHHKNSMQTKFCACFLRRFTVSLGPNHCGADLRSKLVDKRCQVQSSVALVDLAVRIFSCFFRNSRKYGVGSLRKIPTEDTPPIGPGPRSPPRGQLTLVLQSITSDPSVNMV